MQAAFTKLLDKYLSGKISDGEMVLLQEMMEDPAYEETALRFMEDVYRQTQWGEPLEKWGKRLEGETINTIRQIQPKGPGIIRYIYIGLTSIVAVCLAIAVWWLTPARRDAQVAVLGRPLAHFSDSVKYAGAQLVLSDGQAIRLDSMADGVVAREGGVTILKNKDLLTYQGNATSLAINHLRTPAGKRWCVQLSDGTMVWMSAGTSLSYPVVFTKEKRQLDLSGEAYLEVVHDTRVPFEVSLPDGSTIQVLGTHFTASAYPGNKQVSATLLSGSIAFSHGSKRLVIEPGQQAFHNENGQFGKLVVDTANAVMWKEGLIRFNRQDVKEVMQCIKRWYEVEVKYEGPISPSLYEGEMQTSLTLVQAVEVLRTMGIKCRLTGNILTVTS